MSADDTFLIQAGPQAGFHGIGCQAAQAIQPAIRCALPWCECRVNRYLWVSHRRRVVYVETPKAACTSMKHLLQTGYLPPPVYFRAAARRLAQGQSVAVETQPPDDALTAAVWRGIEEQTAQLRDGRDTVYPEVGHLGFTYLDLDPEAARSAYPNYAFVAIVRHPFDRLVSSWRMFCRSQAQQLDPQVEALFGKPAAALSLDEFAERFADCRNHHWEQLSAFMPAAMDLVVRLEDMAQRWPEIATLIGLTDALPHLNRTESRDADVSPGLRDAVRRHFADDLERFGYGL